MLDRLIPVSIIPHIHDGHFYDFMDWPSVVAVVVEWWHGEYGVHHRIEGIVAAHQVYESLNVMEHRPRIMQAVAFGEISTPFQRVERLIEGSIRLASDH